MKRTTIIFSILATLTLLLFSSCAGPDISQNVTLSLKASKTTAIDFGDKINIDYSVTSTLEQPLTKEEYTTAL